MRTLRKAGDEVEPNGSIADATPIPAGNDNYMEGTFTQSSGVQDIDVYKLTVPPGPSLSARLEVSNLPGSPVNACGGNPTTVELRDRGRRRRSWRPTPTTENSQCGLIDGTGARACLRGSPLARARRLHRAGVSPNSVGIWPYALTATLRSP